MQRAKSLLPVGITAIVLLSALIGVLFLGFDGREYCPCARTRNLLNQVFLAVWQTWQEDGDSFLAVFRSSDGNSNLVNSQIVEVITRERGLLQPQFLESGRFLSEDNGLILDVWGRPLVFQVPSMYPEGLTCRTADGLRRAPPLPASLWNPEQFGPVQVWSLGPNGVDDQGGGDDIIPDQVLGGTPPGTPIGPLKPRSEPK